MSKQTHDHQAVRDALTGVPGATAEGITVLDINAAIQDSRDQLCGAEHLTALIRAGRLYAASCGLDADAVG